MTICPNCGFDSRVGKFCINCGQPLPEENDQTRNQNNENINNSNEELQRPNYNQSNNRTSNSIQDRPQQSHNHEFPIQQQNNQLNNQQYNNSPTNQQGNYYQNNRPQNQKSKIIGLILNMLIVGLGYAYVGKWGEGIVLLFIYVLMFFLGFALIFPFFIALIIWIYSLFKTNEMIDKYNQGLPY